jgi:hypothetical protein
VAASPRLIMRKTTRNTLLLALNVVALGAGVFAELRREEGMMPEPLTTIDPQYVKAMTIEAAGGRKRVFEHRANGWWMTQPYPLRADANNIPRLLAVLNAPVRKTLDATHYDLANLGLDKPAVTLHVDGALLEFGGEDPIDHDRYVRFGGKIVRIPDRFAIRLTESPEVEIDRHLIDPDATVVEVSIDGTAPRADVANAWKQTVSQQMLPGPSMGSMNAVVELADTTKLEFSIGRKDNAYTVYRADIDLVYMVGEAQAQALLGKAN